jgi:hypothetical protein
VFSTPISKHVYLGDRRYGYWNVVKQCECGFVYRQNESEKRTHEPEHSPVASRTPSGKKYKTDGINQQPGPKQLEVRWQKERLCHTVYQSTIDWLGKGSQSVSYATTE